MQLLSRFAPLLVLVLLALVLQVPPGVASYRSTPASDELSLDDQQQLFGSYADVDLLATNPQQPIDDEELQSGALPLYSVSSEYSSSSYHLQRLLRTLFLGTLQLQPHSAGAYAVQLSITSQQSELLYSLLSVSSRQDLSAADAYELADVAEQILREAQLAQPAGEVSGEYIKHTLKQWSESALQQRLSQLLPADLVNDEVYLTYLLLAVLAMLTGISFAAGRRSKHSSLYDSMASRLHRVPGPSSSSRRDVQQFVAASDQSVESSDALVRGISDNVLNPGQRQSLSNTLKIHQMQQIQLMQQQQQDYERSAYLRTAIANILWYGLQLLVVVAMLGYMVEYIHQYQKAKSEISSLRTLPPPPGCSGDADISRTFVDMLMLTFSSTDAINKKCVEYEQRLIKSTLPNPLTVFVTYFVGITASPIGIVSNELGLALGQFMTQLPWYMQGSIIVAMPLLIGALVAVPILLFQFGGLPLLSMCCRRRRPPTQPAPPTGQSRQSAGPSAQLEASHRHNYQADEITISRDILNDLLRAARDVKVQTVHNYINNAPLQRRGSQPDGRVVESPAQPLLEHESANDAGRNHGGQLRLQAGASTQQHRSQPSLVIQAPPSMQPNDHRVTSPRSARSPLVSPSSRSPSKLVLSKPRAPTQMNATTAQGPSTDELTLDRQHAARGYRGFAERSLRGESVLLPADNGTDVDQLSDRIDSGSNTQPSTQPYGMQSSNSNLAAVLPSSQPRHRDSDSMQFTANPLND